MKRRIEKKHREVRFKRLESMAKGKAVAVVKRGHKQLKKTITIRRLIPNLVTLTALCVGVSAIRFAHSEEWKWAVTAIILAALLDNLDGRVARLLSGGSRFGFELDALADFVNFGVSPALVLYFWSLQYNRLGWAAVIIYVLCVALRLARFNASSEDNKASSFWSNQYFVGLSAPMGASCSLLPVMVWLQWEIKASPVMVEVFILFIGLLMVSKIPTFSLKGFRLSSEMILPLMIIASILAALLATVFWFTLIFIILFYLFTIPFSVRSFLAHKKEDMAGNGKD